MKFEHTETFNFEGALRGMRNPLESWKRSDSEYKFIRKEILEDPEYDRLVEEFVIGKNDLELAQKLIKSGSEHRKFLRQIIVSVDITAPLYWWKEFDTHKVGTTANSTSTMHKIMSRPIDESMFEISDICSFEHEHLLRVIDICNYYRNTYRDCIESNPVVAKNYWKALIRILPESWLQTRTVTMNYEILRSIVHQRANHKLTEWHEFIRWVSTLPYADELIFYES